MKRLNVKIIQTGGRSLELYVNDIELDKLYAEEEALKKQLFRKYRVHPGLDLEYISESSCEIGVIRTEGYHNPITYAVPLRKLGKEDCRKWRELQQKIEEARKKRVELVVEVIRRIEDALKDIAEIETKFKWRQYEEEYMKQQYNIE